MLTITAQTCVHCARRRALDAFPEDDTKLTGRGSVCLRCLGLLERRAANPPPPCRNPRGRDRCVGVAANRKRQLCTSCQNHERYRAQKTAGAGQ